MKITSNKIETKEFKPYTLSLSIENEKDHALLALIFGNIAGYNNYRNIINDILGEMDNNNIINYNYLSRLLGQPNICAIGKLDLNVFKE